MEYTEIPKKYDAVYDSYFDLQALSEKYGFDDGKFRMVYVKDHPVVFAYFMLGIKLRKYQAYGLDQLLTHRKVAWCWSRQTGKTTAIAVFILWGIFFNLFPLGFDNSTRFMVISKDDDSAKKIISEIENLIILGDNRYSHITGGKVQGFFTKDRFGTNNMGQITFKRAGALCFVKSFPPTTKIVGNSGHLIIDECARLRLESAGLSEDKFFMEYADPVTSAVPNPFVLKSSTPEGVTGHFHSIFDPEDRFTEHEYTRVWYPYTVHDDEGYQLMMEEKRRNYERDGKLKEFEQEYLALFVSAQGRYFDPEQHIKKMRDSTMHQMATYALPCYLGIDFGGQRTSHTVMTVSTEEKDIDGVKRIKRLWHKVYPVKGDSDLIPDIRSVLNRFAIKGIIVDSQGGAYIVPEIKKLGKRVTEMVFRSEKDIKYDLFRVRLFRDEVRSYEDEYLLKEMYAMTNDLKAPAGNTDDAIDSFIMSAYHYLTDGGQIKFYELWGEESKRLRKREIEEILPERY